MTRTNDFRIPGLLLCRPDHRSFTGAQHYKPRSSPRSENNPSPAPRRLMKSPPRATLSPRERAVSNLDSGSMLPAAAYSLLLTAHCLLPTAHCLLPTVDYPAARLAGIVLS